MRRCEKESSCGIDILKKIKPLLKYNEQQINALPIKRDNDLDLKMMCPKCHLSAKVRPYELFEAITFDTNHLLTK